LNGIARQRMIQTMSIDRTDNPSLQPRPLYHKVRELYWAFAHS
jgi:hypothetical protein